MSSLIRRDVDKISMEDIKDYLLTVPGYTEKELKILSMDQLRDLYFEELTVPGFF